MSQYAPGPNFSSLSVRSSRWAVYMHLLSQFGDAAAAVAAVHRPRIRVHSAKRLASLPCGRAAAPQRSLMDLAYELSRVR